MKGKTPASGQNSQGAAGRFYPKVSVAIQTKLIVREVAKSLTADMEQSPVGQITSFNSKELVISRKPEINCSQNRSEILN